MNGLEAAVAEVARTLDALHVPYMVIGGVAAGFWGEPRLTQDVDITIRLVGRENDTIEMNTGTFRSRTADSRRFVEDIRARATVIVAAATRPQLSALEQSSESTG